MRSPGGGENSWSPRLSPKGLLWKQIEHMGGGAEKASCGRFLRTVQDLLINAELSGSWAPGPTFRNETLGRGGGLATRPQNTPLPLRFPFDCAAGKGCLLEHLLSPVFLRPGLSWGPRAPWRLAFRRSQGTFACS